MIPWTVARQAPLSMGFPSQEYWSGWPFPTLGDLSDSGIKTISLASPALAGGFFTISTTWKAQYWAPLVAQLVKNLPAMQKTLVGSLGWKEPMEKG